MTLTARQWHKYYPICYLLLTPNTREFNDIFGPAFIAIFRNMRLDLAVVDVTPPEFNEIRFLFQGIWNQQDPY